MEAAGYFPAEDIYPTGALALPRRLPDQFDRSPDPLADACPGHVFIFPRRNGFCAIGEGLELCDIEIAPVSGSDDDRYNLGFAEEVSLPRRRQFFLVDKLGGEHVGADQEYDDVGVVEAVEDLGAPEIAGLDIAVSPEVEQAFAFERDRVCVQVWF